MGLTFRLEQLLPEKKFRTAGERGEEPADRFRRPVDARLGSHAALRCAPITRARAAADGAHLHTISRAWREVIYLHAAGLREDAARQPARTVLILHLIRARIAHRLHAQDELRAKTVVNVQHHRRVQRRLCAVGARILESG